MFISVSMLQLLLFDLQLLEAMVIDRPAVVDIRLTMLPMAQTAIRQLRPVRDAPRKHTRIRLCMTKMSAHVNLDDIHPCMQRA